MTAPYAPLSDAHLDALDRAGLAPPEEGSRKTFCPRDCAQPYRKRGVSIFPYPETLEWRCRACGKRGKALVR